MPDTFKLPSSTAARSRPAAEVRPEPRKAQPLRERRLVVTKHGDAELGAFTLSLRANEECALACGP